MTEPISQYITALQQANWQDIDSFRFSDDISSVWLSEMGSLSRRLAGECIRLELGWVSHRPIASESLTQDERSLLNSEDCLMREALLRAEIADGQYQNWLIGRSLIPVDFADRQPADVVPLDNELLGLTLFSARDVRRDAVQVCRIVGTDTGCLVARRSRIWVNQVPVLVAELFLPGSPIYIKESPYEHD
ncbi:chorismate--pyruvate lyase [Vibrio sp. HA2012]|uniref:chorismate lyase n=1 Tax=Vibrio sp. HA2012 TaxID=1971595 RepID=UPI000C2B56C7|nr:chorismate lyase [Vibrio sp. HA2012]PJC85000.1 chorismate--pyruvate lyase [Vibrio sp. HA2012]